MVNLGSTYYVQTLPAQQLARIRLYLNYGMIASSNFVRFVMDGDDSDHPDVGLPAGPVGSGQVEAVVKQAYATLGLPVKTVDLGNVRSDNEPFMAAGVPMGGVHGGSRGVKTADEARVCRRRARTVVTGQPSYGFQWSDRLRIVSGSPSTWYRVS